MVSSRQEMLRAASKLQREMREQHGDDLLNSQIHPA